MAVPLTSNPRPSEYRIPATSQDMEYGKLVVDRNARIDKIFSVEKKIITIHIGMVDKELIPPYANCFLSLPHNV